MSSSSQQGWHNESDSERSYSPEKAHIRSLKLEPNNLISESYPIEPDMLLGWRPKLPSGPVPLNYTNYRSEYILTKLKDSSLYNLVYFGNRLINSVKVNQQYDYSWKERNKYKLNLRLLKEAVEFVGNNNNVLRPKIGNCEYVFDSNFESGNLDFVIETKPDNYDCFVKSDTNTKGHCNWYYFTVTNKSKIGPIRLNMCNLTKNANLYRRGMKPYVMTNGKDWKQLISQVGYLEKLCRYGYGTKNYQLQFEIEFEEANQTIHVAYGIPYTYSMMEIFVKDMTQRYPQYVVTQNLCETLGGLPLPVLSISDESNFDRKQIVLISARIHPGQSVSSFVVEGFVRNLLENQSYRALLQKFVFKIVPMVNPDGVVVGNFRTSYSGKDLNRQFNRLNKHIFPEVYYLNKYAKQLKKQYEGRFVYYFDLHGHSTKTNLFCYGPQHNKTSSYFLKCRAFSKIIQQQDSIFSYRRSIFTINASKKNTGRASMLKKVKIPMTFTFELSNGLFQINGSLNALDAEEMKRAGVAVLKGFRRYASFVNEVKFKKHPRIKTRTNISKQKNILSNLNQKMTYSTEKLNKKRSSICKKMIPYPLQKTEERKLPSELQNIYRSIIKEQNEFKEVIDEGGSDSEDETEDLDVNETDQLFKAICRRQINQKSMSNPTFKLKEVKMPKYSMKSQKSEKETSIKEQEPKQKSMPQIKKSKSIMRSQTARLRRPTIPVPQHLPPPPPVVKQVLIQRHFVLDI